MSPPCLNMQSFRSRLFILGSMSVAFVTAFVTPSLPDRIPRLPSSRHVIPIDLVDSTVSAANSLIIATIDSDIANVPENEFKPIFMGGLLVMFGGLISALIVGFIVDSRNLYANLVADSYAQSADDEDFWKGLSEEEKKKAQELLQKVKESKEGSRQVAKPIPGGQALEKVSGSSLSVEDAGSRESISLNKEKKEIGMFSDYGD